jgi:hypothetical protein
MWYSNVAIALPLLSQSMSSAEEGPKGDDAGEDGDGNDANDGDDVERGEGGFRWRERCASHGRMIVPL